MKNIIKGVLLAVAIAALFSARASLGAVPVLGAGDTIKFADGFGASPGGAFILTAYDSTGMIAKGSFQSFCLETNENISFGPFYKVSSISAEARIGGSGGSIGTPPHDPLDTRTAWLYTQYVESPSVLDSVTGWSAASAVARGTAMQQAIWRIEEETQYITSNALADALIAAAGAAGWQDLGRVRVLNLLNESGGYAQDQLYIAPVPEPEIYAMLGIGLGLLGWVGRRKKPAAA
jgi:PEP-CTERM motif